MQPTPAEQAEAVLERQLRELDDAHSAARKIYEDHFKKAYYIQQRRAGFDSEKARTELHRLVVEEYYNEHHRALRDQ